MKQDWYQLLTKVRDEQPLVHNITNVVVTSFTANGLLALGASPVMAYAREEVADMARLARAVVLNIGTLDNEVAEAMILAGKSANQHGVPVIFDPVGVGSTAYRLEVAEKILSRVKVTAIRGNAGEIAGLIGKSGMTRGVDALDTEAVDRVATASACARQYKTIVVMTGKEDIITDGDTHYLVQNGHPMLTKVTGTGCLLSSVLGAFAGVEENHLLAAVSAVASYGVAAELAAKEAGEKGPGHFQMLFLDQLDRLSEEDLVSLGRIQEICRS